MNNNQQQNEEYISMINYLISNLNKAKINPQSVQQNKASMPVFLFEFFVFELYLPRDIIRTVRQPIIACRLLDFATLTLEGRVNLEQETIIFNQGKSSFFEMDLGQLKNSLISQSMYIMFLDINHGNLKIIGSCRLNISVFAYDSFLNFDRNSKYPDPRRNILQLFDNSTAKIGEFEISLLIRREYYKFDKNVEISENDKTVLIKKKKKIKKNFTEQKNEQIFLKAEEKPKENYVQKEVKQPQYYNNFVFERNDSAFNAHPVNKVVTVRSQSQSHITNQSQPQSGNKKKRKKSKNSKNQTEPIPGVNVPINCVDYQKGKSQNKKRNHYNNNGRQNNYLNNLYYNNQQFMQSNYNNGQNNPQYYMSSSNFNQFQYSNNSNNNFYNPNNFNNSNYYTQNINNNNTHSCKNNKNYMMNNKKQNKNPIYIRQTNNDNLNETSKSKAEPNEYLRLLSQIKNQVSSYKDKLSNEQINIKKVKQQRNINNSLNIDQNLNNNNYNDNNNDNNNDNYNDNYNDNNNNNNYNNKNNNKLYNNRNNYHLY